MAFSATPYQDGGKWAIRFATPRRRPKRESEMRDQPSVPIPMFATPCGALLANFGIERTLASLRAA
jgi:hypothetical protein